MKVISGIFILLITFSATAAHSLSLDDFSTPQFATSSTIGEENKSVITGGGILGGKRSLSLYLTAGNSSTVEVQDGFVVTKASSGTSGHATLLWSLPRKYKASGKKASNFSFTVSSKYNEGDPTPIISAVVKKHRKSSSGVGTNINIGYAITKEVENKKYTVTFDRPIDFSMIKKIGISITFGDNDLKVSNLKLN